MIERADIFQLFWSSEASQSAYVEQEWRHALQLAGRKGPAFIRPVYWEKNLPSVLEVLSSIHFAPVDFASLTEAAATPASDTAQPIAAAPVAPSIRSTELAALLPSAGEDLKTLIVSTYAAAHPSSEHYPPRGPKGRQAPGLPLVTHTHPT